ncbi:hypothetical protein IAR50_005382 [Cryptococcus sp. DSM 104548]
MSTLSMPLPLVGPTDIPRRPSPWHDIAHSLSAASLPPSRRDSTPSLPSPPSTASNPSTPPNISSSLALREWEQRLSHPASSATRHQLVHLRRSPTPKLAAERDKMGFIEYKLKLIDPTTERFERLVTQMMWRLKQGKNEAIYEFGLADDGTVVGLTRVEMDSSLRTLELMASEVGATVIILKEIVLSAASISSRSTTNIESISLPPPSGLPAEWIARRPDLDEHGQPRKGNKDYDQGPKGRRAKKEEKQLRHDRKKERLKEKGSGSSDTDSSFFDMDDLSPRSSPPRPRPAPVEKKGPNKPLPEVSDKKRRRSAARQEKRRLDLLRGDGTNLLFSDDSSKVVLPHQPARPSSLRLATPADVPEDSFGDDLLHIPLDSLSLSFADVRTVASPLPSPSASFPRELSPLSDASEAETVLPLDDPALASSTIVPPPTGEELICVEALVVRKVQHGHGGEAEEDGEGDDSEEWGYGGEEDVWGFGLEDD